MNAAVQDQHMRNPDQDSQLCQLGRWQSAAFDPDHSTSDIQDYTSAFQDSGALNYFEDCAGCQFPFSRTANEYASSRLLKIRTLTY